MRDAVDIRQVFELPPEEAIRFLRGKGYRTTVSWSEMMHEDHERAFTVAKIARRDLLESVRRSLDAALSNGTPFEAWAREIRTELAIAGWWGRVQDKVLTGTEDAITVGPRRLRTIYDTNLRTARAAALWQRIQANKDALPYLRYSAVMDGRTRPLHRQWHATVLPVDDPWWQTHFPPNGWRCRCTVQQLSEAMLTRRGLKVTPRPPEGPPSAFYPAGSDRPVFVPRGIDPGFAYAPGADYLRALAPVSRDSEPALPLRAAEPPAFPLPPPRPVPADTIEPPPPADRADAERLLLARWREVVGTDDQGRPRLVLTDPTGEPTVVDDGFWYGADGRLKIAKPDHGQFLQLIARTLEDPDEIWEVWDDVDPARQREGASPYQPRLIRKLLARFDIEGRTQPVVIFLHVGKDGWYGISSFGPTGKNYLEKRRNGTLTYRRPE